MKATDADNSHNTQTEQRKDVQRITWINVKPKLLDTQNFGFREFDGSCDFSATVEIVVEVSKRAISPLESQFVETC